MNNIAFKSLLILLGYSLCMLPGLACNCGCMNGNCGNSQSTQGQKNVNSRVVDNNNERLNLNNISCRAEEKISSNNLYCNGHNHSCGGVKK